jgi:hypothetical protein
MSRTKRWIILIAAGAIVLMAIIAFLTAPGGQKAGNSEREKGGPASVSLNNTDKLAAFLSTSQFIAVRGDISNYTTKHISGQAQSATIETTQLDDNGQINLTIKVENGESFSATINQNDNELTFQVPSDHYKVTSDVPDDGGGDDDD